MNFGKSPFNSDEPLDINASTEQILNVIRTLNVNKPVRQHNQQCYPSPFSQNCNRQKSIQFHEVRPRPFDIEVRSQQISDVLLFDDSRKRIKTDRQQDEDDINLIGEDNKKRNGYFEEQDIKNKNKSEEEVCESNPIIRALKEKIANKRKAIEEHKNQINKNGERNRQKKLEFQTKKKQERQYLIEFLTKKYEQLIYYQKIATQTQSEAAHLDHLHNLSQRIKLLEQQKKKKSNKEEYEESNHILDHYGTDRIIYMRQWKKKLEGERQILQKDLAKKNTFNIETYSNHSYYELSSIFYHSKPNRIILDGFVLPLYSFIDLQTLPIDSEYEFKGINLENLTQMSIFAIPFPKMMKPGRKLQVTSQIAKIFEKASKIRPKHSNLTCSSFFSRFFLENDLLLLGNNAWPENGRKATLRELLKRYQCFSQSIVKYIIKCILNGIEEIRSYLSIQPLILPQNVAFNQKNEIKIDSWVKNQLIKQTEFYETILTADSYLYLPPEFCNKRNEHGDLTSDTWTIGVIFYELLYGKKPFNYSRNPDYQEFYLLQQIEFPGKPSVSEGAKELMGQCMKCPSDRIGIKQILKHPYFNHKK